MSSQMKPQFKLKNDQSSYSDNYQGSKPTQPLENKTTPFLQFKELPNPFLWGKEVYIKNHIKTFTLVIARS